MPGVFKWIMVKELTRTVCSQPAAPAVHPNSDLKKKKQTKRERKERRKKEKEKGRQEGRNEERERGREGGKKVRRGGRKILPRKETKLIVMVPWDSKC